MENESGIWRQISLIHRRSQRYLAWALSSLDIKSSEYVFFIALGRQPMMSQRELSDFAGVDDALTVRAMRALESKGFIHRERSSADMRVILVSLTDKGKQVLPALDKALARWHADMLEGKDPQEIDAFKHTVNSLADRASALTRDDGQS